MDIDEDKKALNEQTTELIAVQFGLDIGNEPIPDDEVFDVLANAVAYMIEKRLDYLLSLLYRLDIDEGKINFALSPIAPDPANIGLARLIWERQKQRIFTKKFYQQAKPEDLEDGLDF